MMPRGRLESVSSADISPAGSRLSSVCSNRKSFRDSRGVETPWLEKEWLGAPRGQRFDGWAERASLQCLWNGRGYSRLLFCADCLQIDSENKTIRPQGEATKKEEPHTFMSLQTNMAPSVHQRL